MLTVDFSRLSLAYVQPLWLEGIDFLWEGVLGAAVWGGSSEAEGEAEAGVGPEGGWSDTGESSRGQFLFSFSVWCGVWCGVLCCGVVWYAWYGM